MIYQILLLMTRKNLFIAERPITIVDDFEIKRQRFI